jgi:hypothetical protein
MDEYSKIKIGLLKSGLPLESMIAESINSLSPKLPQPLVNLGEYFFQRKEAELPNSIDFCVTYDLDVKDCDFVQIAFLIECKYRTRMTGWYFMKNPLNDAGMEFFVENFVSGGKCSRTTFPFSAPPLGDTKLPIAGKGIEIYSNGEKNEKSIDEAVHQLMFGTSSLLIRAFFRETDVLEMMSEKGISIKGRSFHSLLCPVVVTTADIRILEDVDIEKIEKSDKPEDISEVKKTIVYSTPNPPLYVQRYVKEDVARNVESMLPPEAAGRNWTGFLAEYSMLFPSRYYIVNYNNFTDFISEYIVFAESMLTYACKRVQ